MLALSFNIIVTARGELDRCELRSAPRVQPGRSGSQAGGVRVQLGGHRETRVGHWLRGGEGGCPSADFRNSRLRCDLGNQIQTPAPRHPHAQELEKH